MLFSAEWDFTGNIGYCKTLFDNNVSAPSCSTSDEVNITSKPEMLIAKHRRMRGILLGGGGAGRTYRS